MLRKCVTMFASIVKMAESSVYYTNQKSAPLRIPRTAAFTVSGWMMFS